MNANDTGINLEAEPSGAGCVECLRNGGWWFHLRRCAQCGHIGCCDSSPSQHATAHYHATGHPVIANFEPDDEWFYDYRSDEVYSGPRLRPPLHHPLEQPAPGPAGKVPRNWMELLRG
ncbi:UBP-type zinc finger domain-containing protein [Dyella sp. C9]|uniref:UBP-type zinc finger domain-containing protein n=1 Tax=Dyella sp. C9 TaxID=2202154 RepID=UPI000DEEECDB|nr:UBP-type zinc finger domain-containing protein [Dyella sp. C9]